MMTYMFQRYHMNNLDTVMKKMWLNVIFGVTVWLIILIAIIFGYFINKQNPINNQLKIDNQSKILQPEPKYEN